MNCTEQLLLQKPHLCLTLTDDIKIFAFLICLLVAVLLFFFIGVCVQDWLERRKIRAMNITARANIREFKRS